MALSGVKGFDEHESAVENLYFNKEDERILRKILGKVKNQAEQDETAKAQHAAADEAALRQILAKYSVADHDIKALLHWKHATY
ncbi:hypothetical protein MNEG_7329 [Monoraphidium neglectum]|uniref:Uncharacterized protein n=1 Tax=Monoraphidium neglectum TaxID=145388 RepID=A0A0D2MJ45_9CHLO|nr:hypothetical protein MNEG_7329 [Monoraphidium neglectum]KIZ00632.1 hypothetical protein MNEG_7329 [Monoraphidium neglectum]|eukprot:XP_013899651.1 hypothetical protein MNEG_7329 [Monoraphidium neglectum]